MLQTHVLAPSDRLAAFDRHRPALFSIAYRMLGSASGAEDVLQDTYLRWVSAEAEEVRSPKEYLTATVTRLALDHLKSAQARREVYVGPWLPEPLLGVDERDPLATTMLAESLSTAFLVLMERLSPAQRAAFLLREAFGSGYPEIARILETTEANARQLVQRAKQHIAAGRSRFPLDRGHASLLARRFLDASADGNLDGLRALLADDAVAVSDGGGKFAAARKPITGADRVARLVGSVVRKWRAHGDVEIAPVNGGVGLLWRSSERLRAVMTVAVSDDGQRVSDVFIVVNPDKLRN